MKSRILLVAVSLGIGAQCFGQAIALPDHVKLIESFRPLIQSSPTKPVKPALPVADAPASCGHILVMQTPKGVDSAMAVAVPDPPASWMPVKKALPPCPENVRLSAPAKDR